METAMVPSCEDGYLAPTTVECRLLQRSFAMFRPPRCRDRNAESIRDHCANRFAFVHQIETLVDALERKHMRDQIVDVDPAVHVPIDDLRDIGPAACAAERRALPDTTRHELE